MGDDKIGNVEKWRVSKGHLGPVDMKEEVGKKNGGEVRWNSEQN